MAKRLNASQAFDDTWNTASDLENELEVSVNNYYKFHIYCKDINSIIIMVIILA